MNELRTNSSKGAGRTVRSLRDLPQQMSPERDLWPRIEAQLIEARPPGAQTAASRTAESSSAEPRIIEPQIAEPQMVEPYRVRPGAWSGWRVRLAAAVGLLALGAVLAGGVWITHRNAGRQRPTPALAADSGPIRGTSPQVHPLDARGRAAMLRSLSTRLQSLPPPSRQKVLADLQVIEQSMEDIQSALGRDPGNALLREMLSETYQDEQHLFARVQEAGVWTQEAGSGKGST